MLLLHLCTLFFFCSLVLFPGFSFGSLCFEPPPVTPIQLPDISTEAGLLARVFLAENYSPYDRVNYDEAQVLRCMRAQRAVLQNRLAHLSVDYTKWGAPNATSLRDIVLVNNPQVIAGFTRAPDGSAVISSSVQQRIQDVLTQANSGSPGKFYRLVANAIRTAQTVSIDPFAQVTSIGGVSVYSGAYFWRTEGSSSPGGLSILIPDNLGGLISNNRFYTVKK